MRGEIRINLSWTYIIVTGQAKAIHPQGDAKANSANAVQISASHTA